MLETWDGLETGFVCFVLFWWDKVSVSLAGKELTVLIRLASNTETHLPLLPYLETSHV